MVYKDGSTSSLTNHAKLFHPNEWKDVSEQGSSQSKITDVIKPDLKTIKKYPLKSIRRKALNRKLVRYIVKDLRPLSTVTSKAFRDFCLEMDSQYVLPSEKTLRTKLIPQIYKEVMAEIQKDLDKSKHCSVTTDGWTSKTADKYNAFTVHYVDWDIGKLKSKILECAYFDKSGTSNNLEEEVERINRKYKITEKVVLEVADNAPDIQKALDQAEVPKLGCFAHKLNLCAKRPIDTTEAIQELKSKLSKIVRLTKVSSNAKRALRDYQRKVGYTGKHLDNLFVLQLPCRMLINTWR